MPPLVFVVEVDKAHILGSDAKLKHSVSRNSYPFSRQTSYVCSFRRRPRVPCAGYVLSLRSMLRCQPLCAVLRMMHFWDLWVLRLDCREIRVRCTCYLYVTCMGSWSAWQDKHELHVGSASSGCTWCTKVVRIARTAAMPPEYLSRSAKSRECEFTPPAPVCGGYIRFFGLCFVGL